MIPATELRIGNLVQVGGVHCRIMGQDLQLAEDLDGFVHADAISLTEADLIEINNLLDGRALPEHVNSIHGFRTINLVSRV